MSKRKSKRRKGVALPRRIWPSTEQVTTEICDALDRFIADLGDRLGVIDVTRNKQLGEMLSTTIQVRWGLGRWG